ncbi:hypothetical protein DXG03_007009 [Asterophora parasitica]|uniref:Rad21/Rec8-like protein N-terminal domain-containing protein n=1 Tax=Asterophora parasitica TaxID=117018 RepID=A0A9P7GET0_9AGAR|nr:hypothetical protein DXG03_007009 [Asterophora parasitica]
MSLEPKVIVPLKTIRGIKKAGLLKGLHLHFVTNSGALKDGESGEREEKFSLVGSRDDLFARLVGLGGSEWILGLAATLGSKSTFKKLPKRSILTADIVQLCDLIAQPSEPLALRLSSNLLVGVARVYKGTNGMDPRRAFLLTSSTVKQEILMSDVTTCFASLKKEVQELQSAGVMDARLQMDQASVRPSAVTLTANLRVMIAMDFDALVADWDEYLNIGGQSVPDGDSGDEYFDPAEARTKKKANALKALKTQPPSGVENARAEMHTLTEHHDHLLSASFDVSFLGPEEGVPGPSSSQAADFGFDDAFFAPSDGLDIGGLADELAEELGWTISKQVTGHAVEDGDINPDFNFNIEEMPGSGIDRASSPNGVAGATRRHRSLKRKANGMDDDNYMDPELINSTPFRGVSPATSFSRLLLSQDEQPMPLNDITLLDQNQVNTGVKKMKKMRLLLDARTELTDTELKAARAQYIEAQGLLKREIGQKKTEKNYGRTLEKRVWGVPNCIHAPALVDFWQESFKVQVEARTGTLHIHQVEGTPPRKRQKVQNGFEEGLPFSKEDIIPGPFDDKDMSINTDPPNDFEGIYLAYDSS